MQHKLRRGVWVLFWLACLAIVIPAAAQSGARATLSSPDGSDFPTITAYLDVRDPQGEFIAGLRAQEVQILENERLLPVVNLEALHPGVQLVVAIAPGKSFTIRDNLGNSRYVYLASALVDWAKSHLLDQQDDLSLLTADGATVTHQDYNGWLAAFESYQPVDTDAEPGLAVLAQAIDVAVDTPPRQGMGRAVLFITAPQPPEALFGLSNLSVRASQAGVRVSVWYVAVPDLFSSPGALQLQSLADQTGGSFFTFSGVEPIANPEDNLAVLRDIYALSYQSHLTASGTYTVVAEIQVGDMQITAAPRTLQVVVQPPAPIFVSPATQIQRQRIALTENEEKLVPTSQAFEILVEFPDGHPRPLVGAALYADGVIAAKNKVAPFERFEWDLNALMDSGEHQLQVVVTDSLGLAGASIILPVQVTVPAPRRNLAAFISRQNWPLIGIGVAAVGLVIVLVLVLAGRLQPHPRQKKPAPRRLKGAAASTHPPRLLRQKSDPLTQPIRVRTEADAPRRAGWGSRLSWLQRHPVPKAFAYLTPLADANDQSADNPIPIATYEIVFGRDNQRATLLLDDPSVEAVHARLRRENGSFRLSDIGSVAGTWINYTPVSRQGMPVEHGDLIHVGRIGFRFTLREPALRKPVITAQDAYDLR